MQKFHLLRVPATFVTPPSTFSASLTFKQPGCTPKPPAYSSISRCVMGAVASPAFPLKRLQPPSFPLQRARPLPSLPPATPFAAPHSAAHDAWRHMHSRFLDLCPQSEDECSARAASQLALLPSLVCRALHAANHAKPLQLGPTDKARRPGPPPQHYHPARQLFAQCRPLNPPSAWATKPSWTLPAFAPESAHSPPSATPGRVPACEETLCEQSTV
jgi:hypothetical protein